MNADHALRTHAGLYFPSDIGFIGVSGPDARTYLQNLGTNDLRPLKPGSGCELFFTTLKAKTVAHAVVHCLRDDEFVLAVEGGRADALFKHLDHHLISERVELTPHGQNWAIVRVLGPKSQPASELAAGQALDGFAPWQSQSIHEGFVSRQGALHPLGFDFFGPTAWVDDVTESLQGKHPKIVDPEAVEAIRIESGWPRWGFELDENRFVVELDRMAASISYAKGCFLGQEPIVMARDRGQVNRRLMGFRCPGSTPVSPGAKVMLGEVELLKVTSSAYSPAWGAVVGLAYVYRGHQTAGATVTIPLESGAVIATLSSLPMVPG